MINQLDEQQMIELQNLRDAAVANPTNQNVGDYYQYLIDNEGSDYASLAQGAATDQGFSGITANNFMDNKA